MNACRICYWIAAWACSAVLCPGVALSASGVVTPARELPASVAMNTGAGDGMLLLVEVRIENGESFPCVVDTGSPNTVLPTSVEPMLGKRLGSRRFSTLDSHNQTEHLYPAPKLYLGDTPLATGSQVGTWGSRGILGMDCLRHYCVQMDFDTRTLRFLATNQVEGSGWGKPFPLMLSRYATIKHAGFFQDKDCELLIDTGCPFDGYLNPRVYKRAVREKRAHSLPFLKDGVVQGMAPGMALFPECVWDSESYTNLIIGKGFNLVGLRFLGRHLVTFDFPSGMMYLQRRDDDGLFQKSSR
jgi:hypothetical protein